MTSTLSFRDILFCPVFLRGFFFVNYSANQCQNSLIPRYQPAVFELEDTIVATVICPNCHSSNVRRSRTRGIKERLLKLSGRKAFRCKDCGWRGILFSPGKRNTQASKQQSYTFAIIFGIIILALIVVFNFRSDQIEKIARTFFGNP